MAQNIVNQLVDLSKSRAPGSLAGSTASAQGGQINLGRLGNNLAMKGINTALAQLSGAKAQSSIHVNQPKIYGSTMQQSTSVMCDKGDLACMMTGSSAAPTPLAGSRALFASSSRRGNTDMKNTGIVPFSVQPTNTIVSGGDGDMFNGVKTQNIQGIECTDCSAVGENEFMSKCVVDSNLSSALMRFSACQTGANRRIDQNAGSRQIDSTSQRDGTQHNLTNPGNIDSSEGPAGSAAAFGSSALFASRDPAGGLSSAERQQNVGAVGGL